MNQLHHTGNPEVIQRYLFAAKRVAKWLEDRKLNEKWMPVHAGAGPFESDCSLNVENRPEYAVLGSLVCDLLIAEFKNSPGVDIHLNAAGVRLLADDKGNVCGAVVKLDGVETEVYGKKLILACGGVGGSFESLYKYLPKYMAPGDDINMRGVRTCTGDGIVMAEALGAEVGRDMNIHLLGPGYAGGIFSKLSAIVGDPRSMIVNKKGLRVINEAFYRDAQALTNRSPGKVLYSILGAGAFGTVWKEVGDGTPVSEIPDKYAGDIKKRSLFVAEDLDKAAKFVGCDARVLKESIERYEASCKAGFDGHLLKNPEYLVPLGGAPYYMLYNVRSLDSTQGGITVNRDFEAVTPEEKVIGGMYIVGDHVTGFVSEYYGPGGAGMTWAMVSGFLSAESVAEYTARAGFIVRKAFQ
jgi:succinate dehydrogenase/fumarate reductase flavoprotein subunit